MSCIKNKRKDHGKPPMLDPHRTLRASAQNPFTALRLTETLVSDIPLSKVQIYLPDIFAIGTIVVLNVQIALNIQDVCKLVFYTCI